MNQPLNYLEEKQKCKTLDDIVGKGGLLQTMLKDTIQEMLEQEMIHHLGYPKHDQAGDLKGNSRNGHSKKKIKTSNGKTEIEIPRDRLGNFKPQVVKKYQTTANELEEKIISMYAKGMTTRDISKHLNEIYGIETSPALISQITDKVLSLVIEWQSRQLQEIYPIIFLDAIHFKVRDGGKVICKAAFIVLGISEEGKKDILGIWIQENEGANFWISVLTDLKNRGVKDIFIACCDGLKGFPEAIRSIFPKTEIQLCIIHQIRNSLKFIASKHQKEFIVDLKKIYQATTKEQAENELLALGEKWEKKYPLVIKSWENNWQNLSNFFKYPPEIRTIIYTTNTIEGFNRQLRKVTKNRSVFPSDESLRKLLWLATNDVVKKWTMPIQNWGLILSQFSIHFEGRLNINLLNSYEDYSFTQKS